MTAEINISKAQAIRGWMADTELVWLAVLAQEHKSIVEIGSHLGRSTRALADNTSGQVYAIDDWQGPRDVGPDIETHRPHLFNMFVANMQGCRAPITIVKMDHAIFGMNLEWPFERPDMVFIDGDHQEASVKRDVDYWWPLLQSNGLMCGHDANLESVERVISQRFTNWRLLEESSIWAVQKP